MLLAPSQLRSESNRPLWHHGDIMPLACHCNSTLFCYLFFVLALSLFLSFSLSFFLSPFLSVFPSISLCLYLLVFLYFSLSCTLESNTTSFLTHWMCVCVCVNLVVLKQQRQGQGQSGWSVFFVALSPSLRLALQAFCLELLGCGERGGWVGDQDTITTAIGCKRLWQLPLISGQPRAGKLSTYGQGSWGLCCKQIYFAFSQSEICLWAICHANPAPLCSVPLCAR